ncbi:hypothetical protein EYF80_062699 [Liparis tanakae]|uniref:Uncharacterized protein n=1 Tax=Liparis tanakae TaxID=230148 RepID=A0A4Z2EE77_9TELE|nr:hypothetical protein EYF80_062699 [Liparis tanakae]
MCPQSVTCAPFCPSPKT